MDTGDIAQLTRVVLLGAFGLAVVLGALLHASGFCTMGAVSDWLVMDDTARLRQWALAAAAAMAGFSCLAALGWVRPGDTLYGASRWLWLSTLVGGFVYGVGMVLSSGCMSKTLTRIGSGNLKSLVVLLVAAAASFATLRGITAVARVATVDRVALDTGRPAALTTLASAPDAWGPPAVPVVLAALGLLLAFAFWRGDSRMTRAQMLAGAGVGLVVTAMWWLSGHVGRVEEHPETLETVWLATNSHRAEAFSFIAPAAYLLDWLMYFSDANKKLTLGIVSIPGMILGAHVVARLRGEFRWQGFGDVGDLAHHLAGAVCMGVGGVTALGCTIGQGVSGLSTLSLNSLSAVAAMVLGAAAAVRYQAARAGL